MSKETTRVVSGGIVLKCKCPHKFQDKEYGIGMRLMTMGDKKYKCTVCDAEYPAK